jgi:hypothetical protein
MIALGPYDSEALRKSVVDTEVTGGDPYPVAGAAQLPSLGPGALGESEENLRRFRKAVKKLNSS